MRLEQSTKPLVAFALILLAVACVWGHTVTFDFAWDDEQFIVENESIRSLGNIPSMFTSLAAQAKDAEDFKVFRPLRNVHYAINYALSGRDAPRPWIFHLSNLVWHVAACWLLFLALRSLFSRFTLPYEPGALALFAALAYAVHPVQSEVVCWAKGLDDIMASAFVFAALYLLLQSSRHPASYYGSLACFVFALYAKVSALPFLIVAPFVLRIIHKTPWRGCLKQSIPYGLAAGAFLLHRHVIIGQSHQVAPLSDSYVQTLIDMLPVATMYTRLLLGIPPFHIDYTYMAGGHEILSGAVIAGAGVFAALVALTLCGLRSKPWMPAGLGLAWTGLFLLPVSNIVPMMQYMAERFLYTPLAGWVAALTVLLARIRDHRIWMGTMLLVLAVWAFIAWDRSFIWKDDLTLFVHATQEGPYTPRVEKNAIKAAYRLPHMRPVLAVDPTQQEEFMETWSRTNDVRAIFNTLATLRDLYPSNDLVWLGMGVAYVRTGQLPSSVDAFKRATELAPEEMVNWLHLGQAYLDTGQLAQAAHALEQALELDPTNELGLLSMARLRWLEEDFEAARKAYRNVLDVYPENEEARTWYEKAAKRTHTP